MPTVKKLPSTSMLLLLFYPLLLLLHQWLPSMAVTARRRKMRAARARRTISLTSEVAMRLGKQCE